jgi:hypothetical protein
MKPGQLPQPVTALLVIGLMLTTVSPLICRHFRLPDYLTGFSMGIGIGLEILAIVFAKRYRKQVS